MSEEFPLFVFTDLDDSLFQTRAKTLARSPSGFMITAAKDRHGDPLSFHAFDQLALLRWLRGAVLIPVTGRNHLALRRVDSPLFTDYRITSHGSMVYRDEETPEPDWHARVRRHGERLTGAMQELAARLPGRLGNPSDVNACVIEDADVPVYISLKWGDAADAPSAQVIREAVQDDGLSESWRIHQNGRNAAILPAYASKAEAVRYVMDIKRRESPPATFIGIGDSHSDTAFLQLCDFALVPSNSQIQSAWCADE